MCVGGPSAQRRPSRSSPTAAPSGCAGAGREEEARLVFDEQHLLRFDDPGRVVRGEHGARRVLERPVEHRREVAAPRLDGLEQRWMAQPDVDRAVTARRETGDHTPRGVGLRRQPRVDPRNDLIDERVLPLPRPLPVIVGGRTGRRHDRDERAQAPGGDLGVRKDRQLRRGDVLLGRAAQPVQEIHDRIVRHLVETGRQVDVAGPLRPGKRALEHLAAGRAPHHRRESGQEQRCHDHGEHRHRHDAS